jgi:hypothetical protein
MSTTPPDARRSTDPFLSPFIPLICLQKRFWARIGLDAGERPVPRFPLKVYRDGG